MQTYPNDFTSRPSYEHIERHEHKEHNTRYAVSRQKDVINRAKSMSMYHAVLARQKHAKQHNAHPVPKA